MNHLLELGFEHLDGNTYKHTRAPIRAVIYGDGCRLIYDFGEDFLCSLIVDIDNTKHEILMGLTDIKKTLERLKKCNLCH